MSEVPLQSGTRCCEQPLALFCWFGFFCWFGALFCWFGVGLELRVWSRGLLAKKFHFFCWCGALFGWFGVGLGSRVWSRGLLTKFRVGGLGFMVQDREVSHWFVWAGRVQGPGSRVQG